jgi:hypothetical protein
MSVGPNRPPSLLDEDCTVHLPCHEDTFRDGMPSAPVPTLTDVIENPSRDHHNLDAFALTIIMASAFGRFIRFSLKRHLVKSAVLWDPRSKYYEVHSILLLYESQSPCTFSTVAEALRQRAGLDDSGSTSYISHIAFAQALFHLNQCLLNHPFIMYRFLHTYTTPIPLSFVAEALQRCRQHATDLLDLLTGLEQYGPLSHPSFYGYCAMAAGMVHRLYANSGDSQAAETSLTQVIKAQRFLHREPVRWSHVAHMGTLLRSFEVETAIAAVLTNPVNLAQRVEVPNGSILWLLLDYAWLPQSDRSSSPEVRNSLASLLPGVVPDRSFGTTTIPDAVDLSPLPFNPELALPPTYARMLGDDM